MTKRCNSNDFPTGSSRLSLFVSFSRCCGRNLHAAGCVRTPQQETLASYCSYLYLHKHCYCYQQQENPPISLRLPENSAAQYYFYLARFVPPSSSFTISKHPSSTNMEDFNEGQKAVLDQMAEGETKENVMKQFRKNPAGKNEKKDVFQGIKL